MKYKYKIPLSILGVTFGGVMCAVLDRVEISYLDTYIVSVCCLGAGAFIGVAIDEWIEICGKFK